MASNRYRHKDLVAVEKIVLIGQPVANARQAFELIGDDIDDNSGGQPVSGHYRFEMDDHLYTVHITPIEKMPFDDPVEVSPEDYQ